ncbi:MAG: hydrolase [Dethiobacter sp.]|nr:hydrolase [Dethiobacter sp.]
MLSPENSALIVIDIQGNLAHMMHEKEAFFKNVQIMIKGAKILDIPIVWIEQYPQGLGPTIPEVAELLDGNQPIGKITFNGCLNENILQAIESLQRRRLLITGMETHICVYQTVMGLLRSGFEVHIVGDAVSSRTSANKKIGIEKMKEGGAYITSTETVLFELLGIAGGEEFKEILNLVK